MNRKLTNFHTKRFSNVRKLFSKPHWTNIILSAEVR